MSYCAVVMPKETQKHQFFCQHTQRRIPGKRPRTADTTEQVTRETVTMTPPTSFTHAPTVAIEARAEGVEGVTPESVYTDSVQSVLGLLPSGEGPSHSGRGHSLSHSAVGGSGTDGMRPAKRRACGEVERQDVVASVSRLIRASQIDPRYVQDMYITYKENEEAQWQDRPLLGMLFRVQTDINVQMRAILVDWLYEVTEEYCLQPQTLFLAVNYLDRVLERLAVTKSTLQLVGVCCLLIAAKYEEIYAPLVDDLVDVTDNCYSRSELLKTEQLLLGILKFKLTVSTIFDFVEWFLIVANVQNEKIHHYALYLSSHLLSVYEFNVKYRPSLVAASIVCLSLHAFNLPAWAPFYESFTGYSSSDMKDCVRDIFHHISTQKSAQEKYYPPKYGCFASVQMLSGCPL